MMTIQEIKILNALIGLNEIVEKIDQLGDEAREIIMENKVLQKELTIKKEQDDDNSRM